MKQFKLRLPDDLHARLAKDATDHGRSLNEHIIRHLEREHRSDDIRRAVQDGLRSVTSAIDVRPGGAGADELVEPTVRKLALRASQ